MLAALKTLFAEFSVAGGTTPASTDQRQLQLAVAALLHEMTRVDASHSEREQERAAQALVAMFGLPEVEAMALLAEAGAQRLTSYFDPASNIKRMLSIEQRCTLVENLWLCLPAAVPVAATARHLPNSARSKLPRSPRSSPPSRPRSSPSSRARPLTSRPSAAVALAVPVVVPAARAVPRRRLTNPL